MPPQKAYLDNTTIAMLTENHACTMLARLNKLINWFKMSLKSKKARNLSIVKGKVVTISFLLVTHR